MLLASRLFSCGSGGTGRHTILRGWRRKAWGFKSPLPHHIFCFKRWYSQRSNSALRQIPLIVSLGRCQRSMRGRHIRFILLLLAVSSGHGQLRASNPAGPDSPTKIAVQQWAHEPRGAERCAGCHSAEVEGYARSAMAHSLRRAAQEPAGTVTTPDSTITMSSSPKGSWQRLQTGRSTTGSVTNYRVDYVIGSGNHASGYLVNIAGHLFQSPVAFYKSRNAYDLAPGYEKTQDPDFTRPIAEGCVFCHAGTELHIRGTDNQYRSPAFSAEAITCERCHGPSEKHLADPKAGTIVNPAKLEPGARDSICEQCHLMGVTRVLNPGKE